MTRSLLVRGDLSPCTELLILTAEYLVDAHVGKALFAEAIVGALRNNGKTVVLVTHALHFLSQCDYIYTLHVG